MDNQYLKAKEILKKYNQEHLLAFYDKLTQEKKEKEKIDAGKNVQKKKTERYLRPKSAGTSPHSRVSHLTILLA